MSNVLTKKIVTEEITQETDRYILKITKRVVSNDNTSDLEFSNMSLAKKADDGKEKNIIKLNNTSDINDFIAICMKIAITLAESVFEDDDDDDDDDDRIPSQPQAQQLETNVSRAARLMLDRNNDTDTGEYDTVNSDAYSSIKLPNVVVKLPEDQQSIYEKIKKKGLK